MTTAYCFDLDGTITREEILPLISQEVELYDEIQALTQATINGIIPFRKSFLLRCRLLKDIPVDRVVNIVRGVKLYEDIVAFIRNRPDHCYVVTGNLDVWVEPLVRDIGCGFYSSKASVRNGMLGQVEHVLDKADAVTDLRSRYNTIISVGDGMGDVSMFERSDVSIAFGGSHYPIRSLVQVSDYLVFEEKALCSLLTTL